MYCVVFQCTYLAEKNFAWASKVLLWTALTHWYLYVFGLGDSFFTFLFFYESDLFLYISLHRQWFIGHSYFAKQYKCYPRESQRRLAIICDHRCNWIPAAYWNMKPCLKPLCGCSLKGHRFPLVSSTLCVLAVDFTTIIVVLFVFFSFCCRIQLDHMVVLYILVCLSL